MTFSPEERSDYDANRQRQRTNAVADVYRAYQAEFDNGPADWDRRRRCAGSLAEFCRTYGGPTFALPWSAMHLRAIERIEAAVLQGEQFAMAMPRSSGKTSLCRWAVIWAIANGHSPYVVLIGATGKGATKQLRIIKDRLRFSDLLMDDYPELCGPIRHLDGEPRRATSQHFRGTPTGIQWGMDKVVLAHIGLDYAACSEAVIDVTGITGEIRGRQHERRDGSTVRPTVAIVDDPQTRKSARSDPDTDSRLETIFSDVAFMAGPEDPVGVVVPCTVIRAGDLADQILNRDINPEWHGFRARFLDSMPDPEAMQHWEGEYDRLRRKALREDRPPVEATDYYIAHQEVMNRGSVATWPERFFVKKHEVSAVQHAMNFFLLKPDAFRAEYQNEPEEAVSLPSVPMLDEAGFAAKISGRSVGVGIDGAAHLVAMIDVHEALLYWTAIAVREDFTGGPIAKGVYPPQPNRDFTLRNARVTLQDVHPGSVETSIVAGLQALYAQLVKHPWQTPNGSRLPVSLVLTDTGYKIDLVARAIKTAPVEYRSLLRGSRGAPLGPDSKPMTEYDTSPERVKRAGPDRKAPHWYVPKEDSHGIEVVWFDANFWKAALHARFCTSVGLSGEWSLWGGPEEDHRQYIRHLLSQLPHEKTGRSSGRTINAFELRSGFEDHWLDATVGCMVGASVMGCRLETETAPVQPRRRRRRRGFVYANKG